MQMHLITMLMQTYKVMTNGVTYNVFMHHVMIFQDTDVSTQMAWDALFMQHVHLMDLTCSSKCSIYNADANVMTNGVTYSVFMLM